MKTSVKKVITMICIFMMAASFMTAGCASTCQLKELQARVDAAEQKADDAMATAEAAKRASDDCSTQCDQAARDAQIASDRAAAAADKAEAIFMQKMKK